MTIITEIMCENCKKCQKFTFSENKVVCLECKNIID